MATTALTPKTKAKVWTDEELLHIKHEGKVEVVNGELRLMTPAGMEQGKVNVGLTARLYHYAHRHKLGEVYDAQTGYRLYGDLRAPDASFVRTERLPEGKTPKGFGDFPPDLAVEVFAPDETVNDYQHKVQEYLEWGVRLVWLVDPNTQTVTVCRSDGTRTTLAGNQVLSGEDVVPGFKCRVRKLFE
jgi:Uma2 family endonuclease